MKVYNTLTRQKEEFKPRDGEMEVIKINNVCNVVKNEFEKNNMKLK